MWIDAYDVLSVEIDCDQEEIKKAFKKKSLIEHPDKAVANGRNTEEQNQRFNEVQNAREILEDEDRRKRYDTFGQDLGKDPPEMEVWNIGLSALLQPLGSFMLKSFLCQAALWLLTFRWIAYALLFGGILCIVLYALGVEAIRHPERVPILVQVGIIDIVIIFYWVWPLLADTVGVLYLASEVVGDLQVFVDNLKVGLLSLVASIFIAWLVRGWWFWILVAQVALAIVLLIGVTIAAGIIRLWIDTVQTTRAEKVKEYRLSMRAERTKVQQEVAQLRAKLAKTEKAVEDAKKATQRGDEQR